MTWMISGILILLVFPFQDPIPRAGSPGVEPPAFTEKSDPVYPEKAKGSDVYGYVVVLVVCGKDGIIKPVKVIRGLANGQLGFEDSAVEALKSWKFVPGKYKGSPSDIEMALKVEFQPPGYRPASPPPAADQQVAENWEIGTVSESLVPKNDHSPNAMLLRAVRANDLEVVQKSLSIGAEINIKDPYGYSGLKGKQQVSLGLGLTPLVIAIQNNHAELAIWLIDRGANIHMEMPNGNTALHEACMAKSQKVVGKLIQSGAKINGQNHFGETALHLAVTTGNINAVKALVKAGADQSVKTKSGETAMGYLERMAKDPLLSVSRVAEQIRPLLR